jgi:hypothetical protein
MTTETTIKKTGQNEAVLVEDSKSSFSFYVLISLIGICMLIFLFSMIYLFFE